MDPFSKKALTAACEGEPFAAHLSPRCTYLKDKILQSILTHQVIKEQEPAREIRNLLNEVRILFERKLFFFCRKNLGKGRNLALEFGLPEYLLEILSWERRLLRGQRIPQNQRELAQKRKEENLAMKQLKISTELIQALDEALFPGEGQTTEAPFNVLEGIPREPELLTFRAKRALNELKAAKAKLERNSKLALEMKKENYLLWKEHPHWLQRRPGSFIAACNSYLEELRDQEDPQLFLEIMEEARSNKDLPRSRKPELDLVLANLELIYTLNQKEAPEIIEATRKFEAQFQKRADIGPNKRQHYLFNLGMGYYLGGEKGAAKPQFQKILNSSSWERLPIFQDWAFLWRQVILFETNPEDFDIFYNPAHSHFKRRERPQPVAVSFLRCLAKNVKTDSARERIHNYRNFISDYPNVINKIERACNGTQDEEPKVLLDPEEKMILGRYELFFKWVLSKINFSDFLELVQEKQGRS